MLYMYDGHRYEAASSFFMHYIYSNILPLYWRHSSVKWRLSLIWIVKESPMDNHSSILSHISFIDCCGDSEAEDKEEATGTVIFCTITYSFSTNSCIIIYQLYVGYIIIRRWYSVLSQASTIDDNENDCNSTIKAMEKCRCSCHFSKWNNQNDKCTMGRKMWE